MRDQSEIKEMIKALKEVKLKIRRYTLFGDDNWKSIDAQIWVLETQADEDDIYNRYDDEITMLAIDAMNWLNGEEMEDELFGWSSLIK